MSVISAIHSSIMNSPVLGPSLVARYGEPWRHYHRWPHIATMIRHLERAEEDGVKIINPKECVCFALWHDAIYDPQSTPGRNEKLSADLFRQQSTLTSDQATHRVVAMIHATVHHKPFSGNSIPDGNLCLDIDLSILGTQPDGFADYEEAIGKEYAFIPRREFIAKRKEVLMSFLGRGRIYTTDWAFHKWEGRALTNLMNAVEKLGS